MLLIPAATGGGVVLQGNEAEGNASRAIVLSWQGWKSERRLESLSLSLCFSDVSRKVGLCRSAIYRLNFKGSLEFFIVSQYWKMQGAVL